MLGPFNRGCGLRSMLALAAIASSYLVVERLIIKSVSRTKNRANKSYLQQKEAVHFNRQYFDTPKTINYGGHEACAGRDGQ